MEIENLQVIKEKYNDLRFGQVDIYFDPASELMIMKKDHKLKTQREFELSLKQSEERGKLNHPNLMTLIKVIADPEELVIHSYFIYPNEDLYERKELLKNPEEMQKLISDISNALAFLERTKVIHGNLRPEYIYFDQKLENYILLDRLADTSPPNECQLNNIRENHKLYISPALFNGLLSRIEYIDHSPYRSESFSLAMVAYSLLVDENKDF